MRGRPKKDLLRECGSCWGWPTDPTAKAKVFEQYRDQYVHALRELVARYPRMSTHDLNRQAIGTATRVLALQLQLTDRQIRNIVRDAKGAYAQTPWAERGQTRRQWLKG